MSALRSRLGPTHGGAQVQRVHRYHPRGSARALFLCKASEVLVSGPAGTGKSRACLEKIHLMCKKYPGMRALILRQVLSSLTSTGLVTWRTWVIDQDLLSGEVTYYGGSQEEPAQYRYRNGSVVVIGGLDKSIKIMSSEYDVVYVQEATELTEETWEMITTRLRNGKVAYQQLIADANPNAPTHWLKQRCDRGATVMLHSRHEENPVLFDEITVSETGEIRYTMTARGKAYMRILDGLTGVRRLRLRDGKWVAAEGVIFAHFDESIHVVDRWILWPETGLPPDDWTRWWVVDFGFTNPFVCQMWAEDPDGRLYLYREIYRTGRTPFEHAHDIIALVTEPDPRHVPGPGDVAASGRIWIEPRPRTIICDHDAAGRAELRKQLNLGTRPADKAVAVGLDEAQMRFKERRIFICRDARVGVDPELEAVKRPTSTLEEIPGYVWEPPAPGRPPKETPVKDNDHGCDCIRYIAKYRSIGAGKMRILG